ncbi:hypothetical protein [Gloeothece citriformis]|nr:hypothetical protein [Gloeothece citriformis]
MIKTIALTIVGLIILITPVQAQEIEQEKPAISQEEIYWMMKSCEWLKAGYTPWDIEQYLTNLFLKQLQITPSNSVLIDDITQHLNNILYDGARLKARIAVIRASSLLDAQGQCW